MDRKEERSNVENIEDMRSRKASLQGSDDMGAARKGVAVLHGIMGSRLYAGEELWDTRKGLRFKKGKQLWIHNPLMNKHLENYANVKISQVKTMLRGFYDDDGMEMLACDGEGNSLHPIVTAGANADGTSGMDIRDPYGTVHVYKDLIIKLQSVYGEGNVVFFTYDWRKDIARAVDDLRAGLDSMAQKYDVLYLIAHSMGGLAALHYIKSAGFPGNIRLITLGTPFFGAPQALYSIRTGRMLPFDYGKNALQKIAVNIPSVYELLPTQPYMEGEGYLCEKTVSEQYTGLCLQPRSLHEESHTLNAEETNAFIESGRSGLNPVLYRNAREFHRQLDAWKIFHSIEYSCALVGYGRPTETEVVWETSEVYHHGIFSGDKHVRTKMSYSVKKNNDGDGTVPLASATMCGKISSNRLYAVRAEHAALASHDESIRFILGKIRDWDDPAAF